MDRQWPCSQVPQLQLQPQLKQVGWGTWIMAMALLESWYLKFKELVAQTMSKMVQERRLWRALVCPRNKRGELAKGRVQKPESRVLSVRGGGVPPLSANFFPLVFRKNPSAMGEVPPIPLTFFLLKIGLKQCFLGKKCCFWRNFFLNSVRYKLIFSVSF